MSTTLAQSQPPEISVQIEIVPSTFHISTNEVPTLFITVTSHADHPITIFTWPGVLNIPLALKRKNFYMLDLTEDRRPFDLEISKGPSRLPYRHRKGTNDEKYHITLLPETPVVLEHEFSVPRRVKGDVMQPGHWYLFGITKGETIFWWRNGTKEEVLENNAAHDLSLAFPAIPITNVQPVELFVKE